MNDTPSIKWNNQIRLVLSDVDETLAEVYAPAEPEMAQVLLFLSRSL